MDDFIVGVVAGLVRYMWLISHNAAVLYVWSGEGRNCHSAESVSLWPQHCSSLDRTGLHTVAIVVELHSTGVLAWESIPGGRPSNTTLSGKASSFSFLDDWLSGSKLWLCSDLWTCVEVNSFSIQSDSGSGFPWKFKCWETFGMRRLSWQTTENECCIVSKYTTMSTFGIDWNGSEVSWHKRWWDWFMWLCLCGWPVAD